ncbi:MAG: hypothetical protein ACXWCG_06540, partial [Flavitalea sp.]
MEIENRKMDLHGDTVIYISIPYWRDECTTRYLKEVLETEKTDTSRVNLLLMLCTASFDSADYQNARRYAKEALSLSERIDYGHGKEVAYQSIGFTYSWERNYPEARKFFFNSIIAFEDQGEKHMSGRVFLEVAETYWMEENYTEALRYSYAAIKLLEGTGDQISTLLTYLRIGAYYETERNFLDALKNYSLALKLAEEVGAGGLGKSCAGLANRGLANVYNKSGRYTEALERDLIALKIFQELGYKGEVCETFRSIADIFKNEGDIAAADGNNQLAGMKYAEASKNYLASLEYRGNVHAYASLAKIKINLQDLESAKEYIQSGLKLAKANE